MAFRNIYRTLVRFVVLIVNLVALGLWLSCPEGSRITLGFALVAFGACLLSLSFLCDDYQLIRCSMTGLLKRGDGANETSQTDQLLKSREQGEKTLNLLRTSGENERPNGRESKSEGAEYVANRKV
jgi:hypothetical protein